jgi:hypothetical protein
MSDLQCPATFLVVAAAAAADTASSPGLRLAAVYAVPEGAAVAATWAAEAGLPVGSFEAAGGTSYAAALEELADLHRGETVLVVLPDAAVDELAGAARGTGRVLEVVVDADGWSVRLWPGPSAGTKLRA